jgi:hypothetical protein
MFDIHLLQQGINQTKNLIIFGIIYLLMGYEISLNMTWKKLQDFALPQKCSISLFTDVYEIRIAEKTILHQQSGIKADEAISILILHYLIGIYNRGYHSYGEWISFKEIDGEKLFCLIFYKELSSLVECFQRDPEGLIMNLAKNFGGRIVDGGDVAVDVETFPSVFVRMIFWRGDEDLPPEATILFDRGLSDVYIMEDIAVLLTLFLPKILGYLAATIPPSLSEPPSCSWQEAFWASPQSSQPVLLAWRWSRPWALRSMVLWWNVNILAEFYAGYYRELLQNNELSPFSPPVPFRPVLQEFYEEYYAKALCFGIMPAGRLIWRRRY